MDEHIDEMPKPYGGILTREKNIAETVPVKPIRIERVDLSGLLNSNSPTIRRWETNWNTHFNVSAYPNIVLLDQFIKPNRKGKFMPYQEEAIANGEPEKAWSETLMIAVSHALVNAMSDSERILPGATAPQIGISSNININEREGKLIIEVKDNGQGIPETIAKKLSPGYILPEENKEGYELSDIRVGNRLRYIYEAIEQIGGRSEIVTKRIEDLKPGETCGTTVRFIFPLNIV